MKKHQFNKLSDEELQKKNNYSKGLILLFSVTLFSNLYFIFRDWIADQKLNTFVFVLVIALLVGLIIEYPKLKAIREELNKRKI